MPRVTKSVIAKAKHKKVLNSTKGHYGARSRLYKTAKQSNIKSLQYAFRDRKNRKRNFRSLWIARINAGAKELDISYSKLINSLSKKNKQKVINERVAKKKRGIGDEGGGDNKSKKLKTEMGQLKSALAKHTRIIFTPKEGFQG